MAVINLQSLKAASMPLLILADLQKEYVCADRPLGLQNPQAALVNCRRLLSHARSMRIPVAFLRWAQRGHLFNPSGLFSGWIDGLTPRGSDMVFERAWPSAYTSAEFANCMDEGLGDNAAIAGFTGSLSCLATVVEGSQRQHRYTFITDASQTHALEGQDEERSHEIATSLISLYARVETTESWIAGQMNKNPASKLTWERENAVR
ncbi:MAG: isochorismatase family protein [Alphaproteobacteria bacterium]|nr:isochorismatase family protein [Alphaproteobacteria bacterium]